MKEVTLVYPHQLFKASPAIKKGREIYLVEEPLILSHNPIHRQKLIFHKLSLDAYEDFLIKGGYKAKRLSIEKNPDTKSVFEHLKKEDVAQVHVVDTTDCYLERALESSGIERIFYESPLFILSKKESVDRYIESKRFMAKFYKKLRQDKEILIDKDGSPKGGKWSFDAENRKKIPAKTVLPQDISFCENIDLVSLEQWLKKVPAEQYGEINSWIPYTHEGAEAYLYNFLEERFREFGTYEDALTTKGTRLFHSTLSPLINAGLLTPMQVIDTALEYAQENDIPMNSLEGFVRQILGWREFIRAAYECDHVTMRSKNFWKHTRKLPEGFWDGSTGIAPIDHSISQALKFGYNHHIERLMVLGNFMLLSQIDPDEVYKWFMAMYVDAYDWVMVPNIYGMSQFADGGLFATKPYISGSNYIKKMSDYPNGEWEELWTALYWNFISDHQEFLRSNHRLSMMPRMLDKMDSTKRESHMEIARIFFLNTSNSS